MVKSAKKRQSKHDINVHKGRRKSGRIWKSSKNKFSSMKQDKPFNTSWKQKMKLKQELKLVKQHERNLKEAKQQAREEKKKRREENLRRREENAKKAEVVQVIKNTAKLKRLTKKQLQNVRKQ